MVKGVGFGEWSMVNGQSMVQGLGKKIDSSLFTIINENPKAPPDRWRAMDGHSCSPTRQQGSSARRVQKAETTH
jgi:hypothetical protein